MFEHKGCAASIEHDVNGEEPYRAVLMANAAAIRDRDRTHRMND
jgi:hypothetical protein